MTLSTLLSDVEVNYLHNAILKEGGSTEDCNKALQWAEHTMSRLHILSNLLEGNFKFALPIENVDDPKFSLTEEGKAFVESEEGKAFVESNFGRAKRG